MSAKKFIKLVVVVGCKMLPHCASIPWLQHKWPKFGQNRAFNDKNEMFDATDHSGLERHMSHDALGPRL